MTPVIALEKTKAVGKFLTTPEANQLIRTYKRERWAYNTERIGKEDSLSLWWSIEEMENFIEVAKQNGADGLKFYFGAYDENYQEVPEYQDRQTLVMVATKESKVETGIRNKDIYVNTENGKEILAYNRGGICPPACGPKTQGDIIESDPFELGITIIDKGENGLVII